MKRYLLDTNAVIAALHDARSPLARRLRKHPVANVCISSVVAHELYYGAFKSQRHDHNVALVDDLRFTLVDFDREDARHAGEIRAMLTRDGKAIGPYDVLIAGQARARGLILVTQNTREFSRVPELQCEDWAK